MSQDFTEGSLNFSFPDSWRVCRPETCSFYDRRFKSFCGGCKEMDFLAYDPAGTLWLIEVKDYQVHPRLKESELADEVAQKTRDVLAMLPVAGLRDGGMSTPGHLQAGDFWRDAAAASDLRVVLHCELPRSPSKLFPGVKDSANLQQKLRQKLHCVDPHALFTNHLLGHNLPWTVA